MKLQMKREALEKLNRRANEMSQVAADTLNIGANVHSHCSIEPFVHSSCTVKVKVVVRIRSKVGKCFRMNKALHVGA
jgi:hypothetical protein